MGGKPYFSFSNSPGGTNLFFTKPKSQKDERPTGAFLVFGPPVVLMTLKRSSPFKSAKLL